MRTTPEQASQRNIELQGRAVAALNAREVPAELLAPGFRMRNCASAVADYTYRGAGGWRDWMNDMFEEFTDRAMLRIEQIVATSEEFVVASFCIDGASARLGTPLSFRWTGVTWFNNGRVTRAEGYSSRREALEAVRREARGQGLAMSSTLAAA
jgi:ketosteroid isomerase-like protein